MRIARDAHSASTTYLDANFRKQFEDALRMFQSKHPQDSKYNSAAYQYRSKLFRPKTRSVIRKNEAACSAAFFSNPDVVTIGAENDKNPQQVLAAKFYKALLQHRLTKPSPVGIPWYLTLLGGFQDAITVGVVCSYQCWRYREKERSERQYVIDQETGQPIMGFDGPLYQDVRTVQVLEDRPMIELRAVENIRIDPGANWTDPVNTSPYVIDMIPMYLGDVKEMGKENPKTGEPGWDIPLDSALQAAARQSYDSTRLTREGDRQDSKENATPITDFSIVWVHKNIARKGGEDYCWYTLGTEHMLSRDVKPLSEVYFHGERPYVMGCAIIETHKIYPSGLPELGREVQKEINEVTNSRMDNVKLVMNKRYIVKRGAQVDLKSLVRGVPASITLANDPNGDVQALEFNDVTSSSYQEQDRLNVEMDELVGNFSTSSVMTNRKLNETVGGMAMLGQGANQLTEYGIRTFTETWVEPVLRQLVKLEKEYETDETIISLMGEKIGAEVTDELFNTDVNLTVNVGMGATDPIMRINRLLTAARSIAEIAKLQPPGLVLAELSKEVFAAIGYRDGGRFYNEENDPRLAQAMGMIQSLQNSLAQAAEALENKEAMEDAEIKKIAVELQDKARKTAAEIDKIQAETIKTLAEAAVIPDQALMRQGQEAEGVSLQ